MADPWTPGPWFRDEHQRSICDNDLNTICEMSLSTQPDDEQEQDANARLIAAAPELVEALASWLEPWNGFDDTQTQRRCDPATWKRIKTGRALLARIRNGGTAE